MNSLATAGAVLGGIVGGVAGVGVFALSPLLLLCSGSYSFDPCDTAKACVAAPFLGVGLGAIGTFHFIKDALTPGGGR